MRGKEVRAKHRSQPWLDALGGSVSLGSIKSDAQRELASQQGRHRCQQAFGNSSYVSSDGGSTIGARWSSSGQDSLRGQDQRAPQQCREMVQAAAPGTTHPNSPPTETAFTERCWVPRRTGIAQRASGQRGTPRGVWGYQASLYSPCPPKALTDRDR